MCVRMPGIVLLLDVESVYMVIRQKRNRPKDNFQGASYDITLTMTDWVE